MNKMKVMLKQKVIDSLGIYYLPPKGEAWLEKTIDELIAHEKGDEDFEYENCVSYPDDLIGWLYSFQYAAENIDYILGYNYEESKLSTFDELLKDAYDETIQQIYEVVKEYIEEDSENIL